MAVDWVNVLKVQGDIARNMAKNVPEVLSRDDLTMAQASQVYRMVETCAQDFDKIVALMDEQDLDEAFYNLASTLEDLYSQLSVASANKVRTMQGLKPIELPRR
ncbi:hypothetical protein G6K88_15720 [Agrobacterium rhizogenes]|uniref:hypothetical protein n=1 Tax=Rhizobium rhizogenes TaxID=359 RepID=UPI001572D46A|nr:hypothetical protein [Rhizobium rhizogenes]NTI03471.1 hypothetical protein [Rhizobium rhizogenes]NTI10276.1 hypothetical protein [Rhizobium rhizogenes]